MLVLPSNLIIPKIFSSWIGRGPNKNPTRGVVGIQSSPKGTKSGPKGTQVGTKGTKASPKGTRADPKTVKK